MPNREGSLFCEGCGQDLRLRAPTGQLAAPGTQQAYQPVRVQPVMLVSPPRPETSGLCIASMVLGILAAFLMWLPYAGMVLGLLAVVLGIAGIPTANSKGQGGQSMGIAGLVLGIVALVMNIVLVIAVWKLWVTVTEHSAAVMRVL